MLLLKTLCGASRKILERHTGNNGLADILEHHDAEEFKHPSVQEDYTVAIVCAIDFEMSAIRYMLDRDIPRKELPRWQVPA
ncbi:hypothetical protein CTA1_8409 [Colletotrichum tanaceti]|uniref:Uncharacterized protein n=1 Tax=Colletotrichum tanaceti TaxID=1306861 RepID=A0A4U6XG82_9PEZI|nr:hypothetical protein CTA1_8409 [Colletotrichum tanaceti]